MDFWTKIEKRRPPSEDQDGDADRASKRQRTETLEPESAPDTTKGVSEAATATEGSDKPQAEDIGRDGLRRSIALALQHVGFESASREALESFTATVETYLTTFIEHTKETAEAARRERPTPTDFAEVLDHYNYPLSYLKPHVKNPVDKKKLKPAFYDPIPISIYADYFRIPKEDFLGQELSGESEKAEKPWIPKTLPSFPSKHTYRFTPAATPRRDLEKKRAQATADARKGEEALRHITRAKKIHTHKENKEVAQRNPQSRQRHENWEIMMLQALKGDNAGTAPKDALQEIADHSVIVDYTAPYVRKELSRSSRGAQAQADGIAGQG